MAKPLETNDKGLVTKIREIHKGLTQTLRTVRAKIETLETERGSLLMEIEKLKKAAETQVNVLETEVNQLQEEPRSLRELLGASEV